jgi:hypothetical protein
MKRNGKTSAGKVRWRCTSCNLSKTHSIDITPRYLEEFLKWLMSRQRQSEMPGGGRSFRRRTSQFWKIWPTPQITGEIHPVIYLDGIYLGRRAVILIAVNDKHVLGWYVAKTEHARAWQSLLERIAPPHMVVIDGGRGIMKALKNVWPETRVQRCTFHVFCSIKKETTLNPRLPAGRELLRLAKELLKVKDLDAVFAWIKDYNKWCLKWSDFLKEKSQYDGKVEYTHKRLRKARSKINKLISQGHLFTYLDPTLEHLSPLPPTNNRIEGAVMAQLRHMLRDHRGMSLMRRIKAVYWWCYTHSEDPLPPAEILRVMPTDEDIDELYQKYVYDPKESGTPQMWGDALVWSELRNVDPWRNNY